MNLDEVVPTYEWYMINIQHYADNTRRNHLLVAGRFVEYLWDQDLLETAEITADHCSGFMVNYNHLGDQTYNLYASILRKFISYLRGRRALGGDPDPERDIGRRRRPQPTWEKIGITEHEMLEGAEEGLKWHVRDKYAILIQWYLGRRTAEMLGMRVGDVQLESAGAFEFGWVRYVNAKTRNVRDIAMDPKAQQHMRAWLRIYRNEIKRPLEPGDILFPALYAVTQTGPQRGRRMRLAMNPRKSPARESWADIYERAFGHAQTHGARRGRLRDIRAKHGDEAARIMADHAEISTTRVYMDVDAEGEELAAMFAKEAKQGLQAAQEAENAPNVVSFAALRAKRSSAS